MYGVMHLGPHILVLALSIAQDGLQIIICIVQLLLQLGHLWPLMLSQYLIVHSNQEQTNSWHPFNSQLAKRIQCPASTQDFAAE